MNDSVITEIIDNTPGDDNLDSDWDYVSEAVRKKYKPVRGLYRICDFTNFAGVLEAGTPRRNSDALQIRRKVS